MKRSEAENTLEDFMIRLIEIGDIHISEINGFKHVGLSLNVEKDILDFIEDKLKMLPPVVEFKLGDKVVRDSVWESEDE